MKYKFPLSIPTGGSLKLQQNFHPGHEAVDITCGDSAQTYGTPFVCPFPTATLNSVDEADPIKGTGGRIIIEHEVNDGSSLYLGALHLSGTIKRFSYKEGDIVGYVGNLGSVSPAPTIGRPFDGSHVHLSLVIKSPGQSNGVPVNPLFYFDLNNPYRGPDTGIERDQYGIRWAIQKIKDTIKALWGV